MDPIESSVTVGRPRGEVFEYLADVANHWEFTDHYVREVHMTREDTYGIGAGSPRCVLRHSSHTTDPFA